jgi:hypothetical protein
MEQGQARESVVPSRAVYISERRPCRSAARIPDVTMAWRWLVQLSFLCSYRVACVNVGRSAAGESQKQRSGGGRVRVIQGRGIGGGQAFGWSASELTERGGTAKPIARGL